MSATSSPIPGTSTWSIDPSHASVHFKVKHMMIAHVRGEFRVVRGTLIHNEDDIGQSRLAIEIETSSIETREPQRDAHLRSADFLDTERYPLMTFHSTKIFRKSGEEVGVEGDLTIRDVTRRVELDVESVSPSIKDPWGNQRMAAAARTRISRKDFGLTWNAALETGGVLVGDEVAIELDIEFVKASQ